MKRESSYKILTVPFAVLGKQCSLLLLQPLALLLFASAFVASGVSSFCHNDSDCPGDQICIGEPKIINRSNRDFKVKVQTDTS